MERTEALISNGKFVGELGASKVLEHREENENKILDWCSKLSSP